MRRKYERSYKIRTFSDCCSFFTHIKCGSNVRSFRWYSIKLENNYSSQAGIKPENNSCEPIDINICIDFILYNHEELIEYSDTIVIGTVKEILPSRWNTKDGKHPGKSTAELDYFDDTICTDIVISVDEYLKNPLPSREVIVRVVGGTVGRVSVTTDADPSFNNSEKVSLYLCEDTSHATKDIGPKHFIVTDFYRGKYTLTEDGRAITPDENTTLDELLNTINQTNNKANITEILNNPIISNDPEASNNTEKTDKQEVNSSSTLESENVPFISSFWALAGLIGAVLIVRHRNQ